MERDDELFRYADDEAVAKAAEQDGVRLIHGMDGVPDGVYLDTPENRQLLGSYSRDMQRTLTNRKNPHKGYDR